MLFQCNHSGVGQHVSPWGQEYFCPSSQVVNLTMNAGVCFLLSLDISRSSSTAVAALSLGAGFPLSYLSSFLGPPQSQLNIPRERNTQICVWESTIMSFSATFAIPCCSFPLQLSNIR